MRKVDWLEKARDAGKDWRQKQKRETEDEIVRQHPWLNGHEFAQTPEDSEGQGSLVCCSPWICKESDMTSQLNHNKCSDGWDLRKGFSTVFTFVRFPFRMNTLMLCQVRLSTEAAATLITFVRFLSSMNSLMNCKIWIPIEDLATLVTFVRFLSSMSPSVPCKIWIKTEDSATYITFT